MEEACSMRGMVADLGSSSGSLGLLWCASEYVVLAIGIF
jgi:hypothetical protein